jgi:hypothetical protein
MIGVKRLKLFLQRLRRDVGEREREVEEKYERRSMRNLKEVME